jgi:hypothetical protein
MSFRRRCQDFWQYRQTVRQQRSQHDRGQGDTAANDEKFGRAFAVSLVGAMCNKYAPRYRDCLR